MSIKLLKSVPLPMEGLNSIINDLESGIVNLENECPVEWGPQRESLDRKAADLKFKYNEMAAEFSPDDFE